MTTTLSLRSVRTATLAAGLAACCAIGLSACAQDHPPAEFSTAPATTKVEAQKALQQWIDKSPSNNDGRSKLVTIAESDARWSVYAIPARDIGDVPDQFQCVAITSAKPTMFTYSDYTPADGLFDFLGGTSGHCDQNAPAITQPLTSDEKNELTSDWEEVRKIVADNPQSPYTAVSRFQTHVANYAVVGSQIVSPTETRLQVRQTSTLTATIGGKPLQQEQTLVISPEATILLPPAAND